MELKWEWRGSSERAFVLQAAGLRVELARVQRWTLDRCEWWTAAVLGHEAGQKWDSEQEACAAAEALAHPRLLQAAEAMRQRDLDRREEVAP